MARRSLLLQILAPFVALSLIALTAATWEASQSLRQFYLEQTTAALEVYARFVDRQLAGALDEPIQPARVDALCKETGALTGKRITVVLPDGQVIGDSVEDPAKMDNHADRPEVREATAGRVGQAIRFSHTLQSDLVYVAKPVVASNQVIAVVRLSTSLASVDRTLRRVYLRIAVASGIVALLTAAVAFGITRRIARPIQRMKNGAEAFARGDFSRRLPVPDSAELAGLAVAMNRMAAELGERIQVIHRQRDELRAVLSSMEEGVLAVDNDERVIDMNQAAAGLFGVTPEAAQGRSIQEVIRNPKLLQCVIQTLSTEETVQDDLVLTGPEERHLHVTSTVLCDRQDGSIGALLVLNDVTQLRRSERARSEFVANVSHEIRTPVTSIKGYAETLLGGALDEPESRTHFLEIIVRQANRLCALVDDILSLSSLERSEQAADTPFEKARVRGLIDAACACVCPKAAEKQIRFVVTCSDVLDVLANPALLEQAIVNLLDNAVKYSEPESEVCVDAALEDGETVVRVRDSGCGIAPEHLPRVFERFFRVDRARSRKLGGTGLGLAIVKHIVALHGGRVTVESALGKGSCFTIHLPRQKSDRPPS